LRDFRREHSTPEGIASLVKLPHVRRAIEQFNFCGLSMLYLLAVTPLLLFLKFLSKRTVAPE
jgi:hypothetical protein